ncbi:hypothetical protein ACVGOW_08905 [Pseudonocardia saturnea]
MTLTEDEANAAIVKAMQEVDELWRLGRLSKEHQPGWAPLEAIYNSSTNVLEEWVYAEGLTGRSLQGREELRRREADRAASKVLLKAWLTLAVSVIALIIS